ncbi:hypothetical protein [Limnospira platensis]|uniref:hypothetical protein n=1 Tax=Limnospira platensis TaxID=118562 RepID=UPI0035A23E08
MLNSYSGVVSSVNFNHDGNRIVSTSADKTVKLCKAENIDELLNRACEWLRPYLTNNSKNISN